MEALHPPSISFWGSGLEHSLEARKNKVSGINRDEGGREREDRGKRQVTMRERDRRKEPIERDRCKEPIRTRRQRQREKREA